MGIGIAIAAIAITATVASDVAFSVEENKKEKELKSAISNAQSAINSANEFYKDVYKIVKARLEHLKQSMRKLPSDVVAKLNDELQLNLGNNNKVVKDIGLVLNITQTAAGLTGLVSAGLTSAGLVAADGIIADVAAVAEVAGSALAVAGFGLTLYNGITALNKLNDAIHKVNHRRQEAEDAMTKMKTSLDSLLKCLGLTVGSYQTLKDISDDWQKLAENFDKYSSAFYTAMTGFALGKSQNEVSEFLKTRSYPSLPSDVLVLASLLEKNILEMIKEGKTDEQIVNFYAKENPNEGLRFVMTSFFVSTLRNYAH